MKNLKTNITFTISPDVIKDFKKVCKEKRMIQSGIVEDLIKKWLEEQDEEY